MSGRSYENWEHWPRKEPRRPGSGPRRGKGRQPFGVTWWGKAWVEALEQRARLDPNRLPRGRTYARAGAVAGIQITPGRAEAPVQGSRRKPYQVTVRVRQFESSEWETVLDALASRSGHAAALLDGELPPEVAEDVRATGLDLLPGMGEVCPTCSCPDWAEPCKHAAAVCYLVADSLDEDPFLLFQLRGKSREELVAELRRLRRRDGDLPGRSSSDVVDPAVSWAVDPGVQAREAWGRTPAPLPVIPAPPRAPSRPVVLSADPPAGSGIVPRALRLLAAEAARRAWEMERGSNETGLGLTVEEDVARWAAALLPGASGGWAAHVELDLDAFAALAGMRPQDLLRRALAWSAGAKEGLFVLIESWDPAPELLAVGRRALGPGVRASRNRLTKGDRQLRLGRDGRFYPYAKVRGRWHPDGRGLETAELASAQSWQSRS